MFADRSPSQYSKEPSARHTGRGPSPRAHPALHTVLATSLEAACRSEGLSVRSARTYANNAGLFLKFVCELRSLVPDVSLENREYALACVVAQRQGPDGVHGWLRARKDCLLKILVEEFLPLAEEFLWLRAQINRPKVVGNLHSAVCRLGTTLAGSRLIDLKAGQPENPLIHGPRLPFLSAFEEYLRGVGRIDPLSGPTAGGYLDITRSYIRYMALKLGINASPAAEREVYEALTNYSVRPSDLKQEGKHRTLIAALCEGESSLLESFIFSGGAAGGSHQRCAALRQLYEFLYCEGKSEICPHQVPTPQFLINRGRDLPAQEQWLKAWFPKPETRRVARHFLRRVLTEAMEHFRLPWDSQKEQSAWESIRTHQLCDGRTPETYTELILRNPDTFKSGMTAFWAAKPELSRQDLRGRLKALGAFFAWAALCRDREDWDSTVASKAPREEKKQARAAARGKPSVEVPL